MTPPRDPQVWRGALFWLGGRLSWLGGRLSWLGGRLRSAARGLALCGLTIAGFAQAIALALALALTLIGLGVFLVPPAAAAMRRSAMQTRRLIGQWCGVSIADPYRRPADGEAVRPWSQLRWLVADPATWRDLLWASVGAWLVWIVAAAPAGLVIYGLIGVLMPALGFTVGIPPPAFPGNTAPVQVLLGCALIWIGLWAAQPLLAGYGRAARGLLGPTGQEELALRVHHLAHTRSETISTSAAELRRIERDLHDGAQARLVAMGMTLDAAEQLMDSDPVAARQLLADARGSSAKALAELRDLVRGIHPPVLADRGLIDAIRALVLGSPLRVHLVSEIADRPPAALESAVYFAVSEFLTNAAKHAHADQAWIDIHHSAGVLRVSVTDNGCGGADPARGTGMRGIERRLAAFDGVLAVSSPLGGPTVVNMEIPCALSSPKTSSC